MNDHITVEGAVAEGTVSDVNELMAHLCQVTDQRSRRRIRYPLPFLMGAIILAKLCGQHKPVAMAEWLRLREQQVVRVFGLEREMVPSLNTIRRTLAETVTATELQTIFRRFLHQVYELVALYEAFGFEIRHRRGQAVIAVSLTPSIDTSLT